MSDSPSSDPREMHAEITALVGGIAKAFKLEESAAISALENGEVEMSFEIDANGNRYALATYKETSARLYPGAVKQEPIQDPNPTH